MYCTHTHIYFIMYSIEVIMIRIMITKSYILGVCTFKKKKKKKERKEKEKEKEKRFCIFNYSFSLILY